MDNSRDNQHDEAPAVRSGRTNLVSKVSSDLRRMILSGDLAVGDKLPSEAALTREYAVSRTVVREAIASLRADGLVEARQGAGVFVLSSQPGASQPLPWAENSRLSAIIETLELRAAVEIEAAGLAAERRSPAQEEAIFERLDDMRELINDGRSTTEADLAFHLFIADATNNPRFREFLELLGRGMIPRARLQSGAGNAAPADYIEQIHDEHRRIAEAISARDSEGAREAMRVHLKGSQQRYRRLLKRE
ncbi:FadR/GntR family transcriptional regulator [Arhodomonas sp. AD133]|uniref:FadR/GntR family transcriptional regulator n=1 Tax=Arhodomonas sp. AD133 TaxID=3415009 RepID=UPI003EBB1C45